MTAEHYYLVGDIGGTNARFALVKQGSIEPEAIEVLPCRDYENLDQAVVTYLERVGVASVRQVCLAVACPVSVWADASANGIYTGLRGDGALYRFTGSCRSVRKF